LSSGNEGHARAAVERLALLTAAAALRASSPAVAAAFARHRLASPLTRLYGAAELTDGEIALLLDRALPMD
jgi:putative acyl-CoA dehydrogenase